MEGVTHEDLLALMPALPTDYVDYGGEVVRWKTDEEYPDCSYGCRFFLKLKGRLGMDWGVCANPQSPRRGLLTFEHQAGKGCFSK